MPNHPSLEKVQVEDCISEWMDLSVRNLTIKDWACAENGKGDVLMGISFSILCGKSSSENGTFEFENSSLSILTVQESNIENLKGKYPLGVINYYDQSCPTIELCLTEKLVGLLSPFIAADLTGLKIRIAIPKWGDKDCKCLPITDYQVYYEK